MSRDQIMALRRAWRRGLPPVMAVTAGEFWERAASPADIRTATSPEALDAARAAAAGDLRITPGGTR